jgi:hypothetical protein
MSVTKIHVKKPMEFRRSKYGKATVVVPAGTTLDVTHHLDYRFMGGPLFLYAKYRGHGIRIVHSTTADHFVAQESES